ncbi:MAG: hypothetical protein KF805_15145 [Phycisphaeraceae bacterium]|nr:hypothetical protein [Phycisphaeraceae bacterium]
MEADDALSVFIRERPRLFGIAYRMLGSVVEAEDVVQDVWLRWQRTDRSVILNAPAFLATATTRLAINVAESASSRRQRYIGPWLPEPVDTSANPHLGAERGEALELAVLLLLERLNPTERAAYVLREAFNYPFKQIAEILQVGEANARQIVARAGKHISEGRRASVSSDEQRRLLVAFLAAAQKGNVAELEELLAEDVVSYSDGNGMRGVARKAVSGRGIVAKFTAGFRDRFWPGTSLAWIEANGQACALILRNGVVTGFVTVHASRPGIDSILWIVNQAKLSSFLHVPSSV